MSADPVGTYCFSRLRQDAPRGSTGFFTRSEIEEIVIMVRLSLYNHGPHCGAQAIRAELDRNSVKPLPSISTIKRILSRNCLTHARTGYYPEDDGAQCL